jgi:hypothetical protein
MVARDRRARCAANAHVVQTPVEPRNVARLGGAADQVHGFALLLFARELDRGLFRELVVRDVRVFSPSSTHVRPVGRVALRLEPFARGGGSRCADACLVGRLNATAPLRIPRAELERTLSEGRNQ